MDLGRAIRRLTPGPFHGVDHHLFLNLRTAEIGDPTLLEDGPLTDMAHRVVVEITERASLDAVPDARAHLAAMRERGFRVAVDDLGAGYAGLNSFAMLEPEVDSADVPGWERPQDGAAAVAAGRSWAVSTSPPGYRRYSEVLHAIAGISRSTTVEVIGRSAGGDPLQVVGLGPAGARRVSVVLAGLHAMEWIGVESGLALAERLIAAPPAGRRVLLFPLCNPDGYRRAERDLAEGRRRFARPNHHGVDLNRNWPTGWKPRALAGRVPGLRFLGTAGTGPRSEPEVDAICRRLDAEVAAGRRVDRALSLHSFGRMILYPYGSRWGAPDDADVHRAEAEAIRARMPERYRVRQTARWLPGAFAPGMEIDHLHDAYGAVSLLVECSGGGVRAGDPSSWGRPWRWFNPPDPRTEASRIAAALHPFVAP